MKAIKSSTLLKSSFRWVVGAVLVLMLVPAMQLSTQADAEESATGTHPVAASENPASQAIALAEEGYSQAEIETMLTNELASTSANDGTAAAGMSAMDMEEYADLPSEFYLTNANDVTPVKYQNPWGCCWAFSMIASIESSVLIQQSSSNPSADMTDPKMSDLNSSIDYSELLLAYFYGVSQTTVTADNQAGEGYELKTSLRDDGSNQIGGTQLSSGSILVMQNQCLGTEEEAPYRYRDELYTSASYGTDSSAAIVYMNDSRAGSSLPRFWEMSASYLTGEAADARNYVWSADGSKRNSTSTRYHVYSFDMLPAPAVYSSPGGGARTYQGYNAAATQTMKETLVSTGALAISFNADTSLPDEAAASNQWIGSGDYITYTVKDAEGNEVPVWAQYNSQTSFSLSHGATIVGWDDSYPKENFRGTVGGQPEGDGAWLVKSSWGSDSFFKDVDGVDLSGSSMDWGYPDDNGTSGFFWVSYYDHSIASVASYKTDSNDNAPDYTYQYDYLGPFGGSSYMTTYPYSSGAVTDPNIKAANVFTAGSSQELDAVATFNDRADADVNIWVYLMDDDDANPEEGTLVSTQMAHEKYAGYHRITLDNPVKLQAGQKFAVVVQLPVTLDGSDGQPVQGAEVPLEWGLTDDLVDSSALTYYYKVAPLDAGQSYLYTTNDGWMDVKDKPTADFNSQQLVVGNAVVKAYTNDIDDPVYYGVKVNGIQVTSWNKDDVLGDGTVVFTPGTEPTYSNPDGLGVAGTLSLSNAHLAGTSAYPAIECDSGLNIVLSGDNTATMDGGGSAIVSTRVLNISGDGTLVARGGDLDDPDNAYAAIDCPGVIDATGENRGGWLAIGDSAHVTATGGNLTGSSDPYSSFGIFAAGGATIRDDAVVTATGGTCNGAISSIGLGAGALVVSGSGTLSAIGADGASSFGIAATSISISDTANVSASASSTLDGTERCYGIYLEDGDSFTMTGGALTTRADCAGDGATAKALTAAPDLSGYASYRWRNDPNSTYTAGNYVFDADTAYTQILPGASTSTGDLVVTKTVKGSSNDGEVFQFTVTLSDATLNGTYGDLTFADGVARFALAGGGTSTAAALPAGLTYTVAEDDYSTTYDTASTGASGTVPADSSATAAFTNTSKNASGGGAGQGGKTPVPSTGDSAGLLVALAVAAALIGIGFVVIASRRTGSPKRWE